MKVCYLVALLASVITSSYGNTAGRTFHLVFLENTVEAPRDNPLEIHVSNLNSLSATVTVSSPKTSCGEETKVVPANSVVKFNVCWWMRLLPTDYWPTHKTVLVESSRDVMVYGFNKELFSADGFFAVPTDELAFSYVLAAYDEANIATQFAISALEDTNVQITLPSNPDLTVQINYRGLIHTNGDTFTIVLGQYETYLGQSRGDLTGAFIVADKPIAVFSGNVRNKASAGSRDHLVAQLLPTGDFGTKFALSPVPRTENYGDNARIIASKANTVYTIRSESGIEIQGTLQNPGDYYGFSVQRSIVITTTEDVEVIQMVRSQASPRISDVADPAMFLLVSESQWLNEYRSPALTSEVGNGAAYQKNFAFLAIASGNQNGLRINGGTFSTTWDVIDGVAMSWVAVSSSSQRFSHVSNVDFGVMVYGASDRESYAFALGADLSNSKCQASFMVRSDGVDNDCDGQVDEESCNSVDDDGDGRIDEDCVQSSTEAFGNEYVIMFMENNVDDNPNAQSFLEIYISAVDSAATVSYTLTNENGVSTRTIAPGEVDIFTDLPVSLRHTGSGLDTKSIHIVASEDIVVYGINKQTWSTDGFLALPVDVVGTEYYTAHFHPGSDLNEFAFTPVLDDGSPTQVTVTMPNRDITANYGGVTIGNSQSFTVNVNFGETAQFQAATNDDNLNGVHISSTKPIAVFSGNVRARVDPTTASSRDHLVQQLAPVSTWGTEFITLPVPREDDRGDFFYITASTAGTSVDVAIKSSTGAAVSDTTYTLAQPGDFQQIEVGSFQYSHIQSTRPVQVFQYVKTTANKDTDNADPAMMLIPPVEQWSRNYQFVTPRTGQEAPGGGFEPFQTFVMIAIARNDRDGLRLDGVPLNNPSWVPLTAAGTAISATQIEIGTVGRHSLTHIDEGVYFQALMYGRADRESYALPLGMRLVAQGCVPTTQTDGDNIDNDCDGSIDEEVCNGIDDDIDGAVDEDCGDGDASGTEFYITYMENTVEYPQDLDLELYIAVVGSERATVTVRVPLFDEPSYDMTTMIEPGVVQGYGLTHRLRNLNQGISGKTIYVRASSDVVVYGVNKEKFSNDAFLVYPQSALGTDYYTCSWAPSTLDTEFAVVATADSTTVTITLPNNRANLQVEANGNVYSSGQSFTVTLDRFQVYQGQSEGDLTGTRVRANRGVAVYSGNVRTLIEYSASRDHLVQQMLPTGAYGTTFQVVPFPDRTVGDSLRIVASTSNTGVFVNGARIDTLGAGEFASYSLSSSSSVTLTASNPVMVVQFVKSQDGRDNTEKADPSMFIIPSVDNYVTSATFATPVYTGGRDPDEDYLNFVTLIIQNGQQGNVRVNGNSLVNPDWQRVSSSDYRTTTFTVESGRSHTVTTTSGARFYGRLYGRADRESYAFPIGFRF